MKVLGLSTMCLYVSERHSCGHRFWGRIIGQPCPSYHRARRLRSGQLPLCKDKYSDAEHTLEIDDGCGACEWQERFDANIRQALCEREAQDAESKKDR